MVMWFGPNPFYR